MLQRFTLMLSRQYCGTPLSLFAQLWLDLLNRILTQGLYFLMSSTNVLNHHFSVQPSLPHQSIRNPLMHAYRIGYQVHYNCYWRARIMPFIAVSNSARLMCWALFIGLCIQSLLHILTMISSNMLHQYVLTSGSSGMTLPYSNWGLPCSTKTGNPNS